MRAVKWEKLYDPVLPSIFINWTKENDLFFPEELAIKIETRAGKLIDWKEQYTELHETTLANLKDANAIIDHKNLKIKELESAKVENKPLHTKERETLLKLVIGMAVGGYGYDPNANRSPTAKEIADDLAEKGISIDPDTVRKWLKEASEVLPPNPENVDS